jgi:hypothetical protein
VPVPGGKPFPRVNDAEVFRSRIRRMSRMMTVIAIAALGLTVVFIAGLAIRLLRRGDHPEAGVAGYGSTRASGFQAASEPVPLAVQAHS